MGTGDTHRARRDVAIATPARSAGVRTVVSSTAYDVVTRSSVSSSALPSRPASQVTRRRHVTPAWRPHGGRSGRRCCRRPGRAPDVARRPCP